MIDSRDGKAWETSGAVVSEDQASTVSVRGFEKRAVKEKGIDSLIAREIINHSLGSSRLECIIPSDERICSDHLCSHFVDS